MLNVLTAFAAMAMLQAPASDADVACVIASVPEADRRGIFEEMRRNAPSRPSRDRLFAGAAGCAERLGWADARREHAGRVAAATILSSAARAELTQRGFDIRPVDAWIARRLDRGEGRLEMSAEDGADLAQTLVAGGARLALFESVAEMVGAYAQTQLFMEMHRRGRSVATSGEAGTGDE